MLALDVILAHVFHTLLATLQDVEWRIAGVQEFFDFLQHLILFQLRQQGYEEGVVASISFSYLLRAKLRSSSQMPSFAVKLILSAGHKNQPKLTGRSSKS